MTYVRRPEDEEVSDESLALILLLLLVSSRLGQKRASGPNKPLSTPSGPEEGRV